MALFPSPFLPRSLLFPGRKLFASGQALSSFFRKMCPFSRFRKAKKAQNHSTVPGVMLCVIRTIRMCPAFLGRVIKKLHPFGWSFECWHYLSSRAVTRQVLSALVSLTSVFGMGTGGPSQQSIPTRLDGSSPSFMSKCSAL